MVRAGPDPDDGTTVLRTNASILNDYSSKKNEEMNKMKMLSVESNRIP